MQLHHYTQTRAQWIIASCNDEKKNSFRLNFSFLLQDFVAFPHEEKRKKPFFYFQLRKCTRFKNLIWTFLRLILQQTGKFDFNCSLLKIAIIFPHLTYVSSVNFHSLLFRKCANKFSIPTAAHYIMTKVSRCIFTYIVCPPPPLFTPNHSLKFLPDFYSFIANMKNRVKHFFAIVLEVEREKKITMSAAQNWNPF